MIRLRPAGPADAEALRSWRNDPATRVASFSPDPVDAEAHARWLAARLADPRCALLIATDEDGDVGQVRLDVSADDASAEVSIGLAPHARGRGLAAIVLELLTEVARERGLTLLVAEVKPENEPSLRAFARAGYRERARTPRAVVLERPLT